MKFKKLTCIIMLCFCMFVLVQSCLAQNVNGAVPQKLLSDFNYYLGNNSIYAHIMALDRANGILNVYKSNFTAKELQFVANNAKIIEGKIGDFSTVYFAYSKTGLHFIALAQPLMSNSFAFVETANKISGNSKETNLLTEIGWSPKGYYAVDLLVQDLNSKRSKVNLNITVSDADRDTGEELNPITIISDNETKKIIDKYGRKVILDNNINIGQWHLYLFDQQIGTAEFKIVCEGEVIYLSQYSKIVH